MTFVSLAQSGTSLSCTTPAPGSGGTVSCTAVTYPAGGTTTLTLTGHIPPGTSSGTFFQNSATVLATTADPNPENNSGTTLLETVVSTANVSVTKSGPATATAGTNIAYTLTVANAGPDAALNVQLSDPLPASTTFVSLTQDTGPLAGCSTPVVGGTGTVTCSWATLASGASAQFTLTIKAGNTASITNTASVTTNSSDTNPGNNNSTASTTVTPSADVAVTKTGPASVTAGANATYSITVANGGPSDAASVTLTDTVPAGTTFVSENQTTGPTFACTTPVPGAGGTITCTIATLPAGASATFSVVVNISVAATGSITNTATVTATTFDPNPANNSSSAVIVLAPTAIPTLSSSTFALLGLVLAAAGVAVLRRRPASPR